MRINFNHFLMLILLLCCCDCGKNVYTGIAPTDPALDATKALEENRPEAAIAICLEALGPYYKKIYDNINVSSDLEAVQTNLHTQLLKIMRAGETDRPANLVSILASAQALKYGIDLLAIALAFNKKSDSETSTDTTTTDSSSSTNSFTLIFPVLPAGTDENLLGLQTATTIIQSLGSTYATKSDYFKFTLFLIASMALINKSIDTNQDGSISAEEAAGLTPTKAGLFMSQLITAQIAVAEASGADSTGTDSTVKKNRYD